MSTSDPREGAAGHPEAPQSAIGEDPGGEDLCVGDLIDGRYRVLELLGRGGMGTVYKAEHVTIRRVVAVKLLHPFLARIPEVSRRFEREAFAIGRIAHPNCVNVSDFGRLDDGSLFLVMEYLEGCSLGDAMVERSYIDPVRALRILQHVLAGLGHAHDNGIVHRDVKPENVVLIDYDGDPDFAKILDFGIAKLMGDAAQDDGGGKLTQAGVAFGTPIYMSPEQAVGNPIDGRADLYAATVMAYEMIAGRPPFQSEDKIEIMSMHTSKPVPLVSELAPEVYLPSAVERLLQRGLAKRPDDRFSDARAYIAAIDEVLDEIANPIELRLSSMEPLLTPMAGLPQVTPGPEPLPMAEVQSPTPAKTPVKRIADMLPSLLAQLRSGWRRPSRRRIGLALAAVLSVIVIIVMVVTAGGDPKDEPVVAAGVQSDAGPGEDATPVLSLAEQAAEKLDQGQPQDVIALLTADEGAVAEDAAAQLQLGHAYASLRQYPEALASYRTALDLDPALAENPKLLPNLLLMRNDRSIDVVLGAATLMFDKLQGEEARSLLIELASRAERTVLRHRAIAEAQTRKVSDRIDWADSLMMDLEDGKTCKERREVVAKLRALGDGRAIPALEKALGPRGRRGRRQRRRNACLRQDAAEAIQYLKSLPPADAGAP